MKNTFKNFMTEYAYPMMFIYYLVAVADEIIRHFL